jgi:hypothetical protein
MPDEPIRELILQHCEASLWEIDGTGAYHTALRTVVRGKPVPEDDPSSLPAAFLDEGDETYLQEINLLITRTLPITVEARLRSTDGALPTLANRLFADIERAITTDPTQGGLAVRTELTASTILVDESPGILASVRAEFEITYHTRRGDPSYAG